MIRKKFVEVKATITDGEKDLGVYTYTGKPVSDMRLLKWYVVKLATISQRLRELSRQSKSLKCLKMILLKMLP